MKKQLVIVGIVVILLTVGLSGCLETNKNNNEPGDEEQQSETGFEWFQVENLKPISQFHSMESGELVDNRIGAQWDGRTLIDPASWMNVIDTEILGFGLKRVRLSINGVSWDNVDTSTSDFNISLALNDSFDKLIQNDVKITYVLSFWDKSNIVSSKELPCPRFQNQDEINRYLDFVRYVVSYFGDDIEYFEIWNEPNIGSGEECCFQWIKVDDYLNLIRQVVPVIRQENSNVKIKIGSTTHPREQEAYNYLFDILNSDLMPLVDAICWHVGPCVSPAYEYWQEYYYNYSSIVEEIKTVASSHGFKGEYIADELTWWTPEIVSPYEPWTYPEIITAKYYARGIIMHLGMNVTVGVSGISIVRNESSFVIQNLCTLLAGAKPANLPVEIKSKATNIKNYSFYLPNNDLLIALWTDGAAVENDTGVNTTIIINGVESSKVIAIDVLEGYEQQLLSINDKGNLTIPNLLVRDYPLIIHIKK